MCVWSPVITHFVLNIDYRIAGKFGRYRKFGKFGESSAIRQTKTIKSSSNPLADLFIRQTFFQQMLQKSKFTKNSPHQTFLLYAYGMCHNIIIKVIIRSMLN